jgi:hypothetical protein
MRICWERKASELSVIAEDCFVSLRMKTEPSRRRKVEKRRGLDVRTDHENRFYFIYI